MKRDINTNKETYRVDFFGYDPETGCTNEHIGRGFNDLQQAVNSAHEGRRDGYKTYLLKHVFDNQYTPLCELI